MDLENPVTRFKEPINAYVLHLSRFPGGALDAISRIPDGQSGIYFWYRAFNYPTSKEGFTETFKKDLFASKFPTRTGFIKPYFEVSIGSFSGLSRGKIKELEQALENDSFRAHIQKLLDLSIMFQAPLYIGKSSNVRKRIETHLTKDSPLQERLLQCDLSIKDTALLVMPMQEDSENELKTMDDELLYEEIFSRLFNPPFNLRIG